MSYVQSVFIYLSCLLLPYHAVAADNILPASQVFIPRITQTTDTDQTININKVTLSPGINKTDPFFGRQSIWYGGKTPATIQIHYQNPNALTAVDLQLKYQGCQDSVICYPPEKTTLAVQLPVNRVVNDAPSSAVDRLFATSSANTTVPAASSMIAAPSDNGLAIAETDKPLPPEQAFPFTLDSVDEMRQL